MNLPFPGAAMPRRRMNSLTTFAVFLGEHRRPLQPAHHRVMAGGTHESPLGPGPRIQILMDPDAFVQGETGADGLGVQNAVEVHPFPAVL